MRHPVVKIAKYVAVFGLGISLFPMLGLGQDTAPPASAQASGAPDGRRGQFAGMARVAGEVTAVSGATITIKAEDGNTVQVVTTDNTREMKDRAPAKIGVLQAGDGLLAVGNLDTPNHTLHAAMVMATDAAQVKLMRENLGKTYITGRVTAIDLDNAKMTVERPDHVSQVIGFDDSTSFKRAVRNRPGGASVNGNNDGNRGGAPRSGGAGMGAMAGNGAGMDRAFESGESITLADVKVGDLIGGTGSVKKDVFVPTHLLDIPPGQRRAHDGAPPAGSGAPSATPEPQSAGPGAR